MSLYIEKIGQGEPLVMIHGWGMHSGMWMQTRDLLSMRFELHLVDLPGMGYSKNLTVYNLHTVAESIAERVPANAYVLGWSLGGLIATKIALIKPTRKLVLVGSTPCFVSREDWQQGMPVDVFESFFASAIQDYQGTMNKLFALVAMGGGNARATSKMLRECLGLRPAPDQKGLLGALDVLRTADLRTDIPSLKTPTLLVHGSNDKLASLSAAEWMAQALPNAQLIVFQNAAHEPFISHPELFSQKVTEFLKA